MIQLSRFEDEQCQSGLKEYRPILRLKLISQLEAASYVLKVLRAAFGWTSLKKSQKIDLLRLLRVRAPRLSQAPDMKAKPY